VCGRTILVTESPTLVEPVAGEFPLLRGILEGMFVDGTIDQRPFFLGWLKVALTCLRAGEFQPGQALVLAGPRDTFKSSLQNLLTVIFGGRSAKPYRYMADQTSFNRDLFEAEHLLIEDEVASTQMSHRRHFGAKIKEITVNETNSLHAKGRDALMLRPFWRITISVNDEPENLQILPPIDESLLDKLILLRVKTFTMPMPTATLQQRKILWTALIAELPAFLDFLLEWEIPHALVSNRFGIVHYHHPALLAEIESLSPEFRLLSLIDLAVFGPFQHGGWQGTAEELHHLLVESSYRTLARELLDWPNATGTYLGRLAHKRPERVASARTNTIRSWVIHPPVRVTP
jgi:hypothetical protein